MKTVALLAAALLPFIQVLRVAAFIEVLDENYEDPAFPGMCVSDAVRRFVPVGEAHPVESNPRIDDPFAPPRCEQVACVRTTDKSGIRGVYRLQREGCENTAYDRYDRRCDLHVPDSRLPYPHCCPRQVCSPNIVFPGVGIGGALNAAGSGGVANGGGSSSEEIKSPFLGSVNGLASLGPVPVSGTVAGSGGNFIIPIRPSTSRSDLSSGGVSVSGQQQAQSNQQQGLPKSSVYIPPRFRSQQTENNKA